MSGCTYADKKLTIEFNVSLLRGDSLVIGKIPAVGPGNTWQPPKELADSARLGSGSGKGEMASEGSQLYVQTDAKMFCIEKRPAVNATGGPLGFAYCPKWAGGDGTQTPPPAPDPEAPPPPTLDGGWVLVNYTKASDSSIVVDLAPLNGSAPTAVQYAWGVADCCDHSDADLYGPLPKICRAPVSARCLSLQIQRRTVDSSYLSASLPFLGPLSMSL